MPMQTTNINPSLLKPDAPIGIFDSGLGGLSVFLHLKQQLPNEYYVYYADTLNVPYGSKSSDEIKNLTLNAIDWLVTCGCKLVVIACNSASAHALELARIKYPTIPIVGLVPALKPAVLQSNSKNVAVLATQATLNGDLLNKVINEYAIPSQVNVIKCFDPNLVPWVEAGMPIESDTPKHLIENLKLFADQKVDHLVLGCTHYPFFREFISNEVTRQNLGIKVLDSGAAIAARVKDLLNQQNASNKQNQFINGLVNKVPLANGSGAIEDMSFDINYSDKGFNILSPYNPKLSFFVSDPKANLKVVSAMVKRLIDY